MPIAAGQTATRPRRSRRPGGTPGSRSSRLGGLQTWEGSSTSCRTNKAVIDQKFQAEVDQSLKDARQRLATTPPEPSRT